MADARPPRIGVRAGHALAGAFSPPGDKSITHRALLFGLLANGETTIGGANPGEDCGRSAAAAAALGASVAARADGWRLAGTGGAPVAPRGPLECGNSGTSMRLLAGIVAGCPFESTLTGDPSLSRRPMRRIADPLARMGARVTGIGEACTPPLRVHGGRLHGIVHEAPVASAQIEACVLLAGLAAAGETRVTLPGPARDHTLRLLPAFGATLDVAPLRSGGRSVTVAGGQRLTAAHVEVPGDFSAAAFLLAAAAALPGARVTARGVNLNPTRTGLLDVLREMGAGVTIEAVRDAAGEPVGDVTVTGPDMLRAFDVPPDWVPRLIDEVPAWTVAASAARGVSRLSGAAELRVKESDRIAALAEGLGAVGIEAVERPDGLEVRGGEPRGGARIRTRLDHRIAMGFAVLACRCREPLWFDDLSPVPTSYPGFFDALGALGAALVPDPAARGEAAS